MDLTDDQKRVDEALDTLAGGAYNPSAEVAVVRAELNRLWAESGGAPGLDAVHVGATLYGFCGGMFGRDSYGDKVVEALGRDWCVSREDNGEVSFAWSPGQDVRERLVEYTAKPESEW